MIEQKLNDEIIDGLCPFIKSAFKLIEISDDNEYTYAYLLLLATGIERLQKIIYILISLDETNKVPKKKKLQKLSHNIIKTYEDEIKQKLDPEELFTGEEHILKKSLEIITDIVMTLRYANYDFTNELTDIPSHLVTILDGIESTYESNVDYETISKSILGAILQKYIASLVYLIWHKKVGTTVQIHPICLQDFITKGYIENNLNKTIEEIIEKENKEARDRQ